MTDNELRSALAIKETRGYVRETSIPVTTMNPAPFAAIECRRVSRDGSQITECCWIGEKAAPVPISWDVLRELGHGVAPQVLTCFPWPLVLMVNDPERKCAWYIRMASRPYVG